LHWQKLPAALDSMQSVDVKQCAAERTWNTGERSLPVARPRYQRGYVRLRGSNYELRFREDFISAEGKLYRQHRSIVLGAFRTKKEAKRVAEVYLRPLNQGTRQPQFDITLADFWSRYFEAEILPNLKFSTRQLYRSLAEKHLLPYFGGRKLHQVTRVEVQQFVGLKRREGYSSKTLEHLRNLLSRLFATANSWGWLEDNPAHGLKLPPGERRRQARVLSGDEIRRLLQVLPEPSRTIFALGVATGLRIGELLALQVLDIDLSAAILFVRRAIYRGELGTPKSPKSERRIPLASLLVHTLRSYLEARRVESEWLFASEAGTPLDDRNLIRRQVEPVCKDLGMPHFSWHSLRHTFRTIAGNRGVPPELVQSFLGHASLDTTMLYMHRVEEAERQAVEKVAEILCPIVPKVEPEGTAGLKLIQ
jgi:integrase